MTCLSCAGVSANGTELCATCRSAGVKMSDVLNPAHPENMTCAACGTMDFPAHESGLCPECETKKFPEKFKVCRNCGTLIDRRGMCGGGAND